MAQMWDGKLYAGKGGLFAVKRIDGERYTQFDSDARMVEVERRFLLCG